MHLESPMQSAASLWKRLSASHAAAPLHGAHAATSHARRRARGEPSVVLVDMFENPWGWLGSGKFWHFGKMLYRRLGNASDVYVAPAAVMAVDASIRFSFASFLIQNCLAHG